ncbi:hypothetical protein OG413_08395 [Streptomyces sp. NBC_01433]|uniref:hypothetical protein n=1 Tax=Streptomyces sp. NBC_01433 TaxID=2903864 RepID=UPI00225B485E|nr:hypothetical protein [Streptomyces sp. NBC_01433]MCX4675342.1 hypothetical protein [Streptomyces sp. NBC_01433]
MSFEEITQKTYCPFAKPSKMGRGITIRTDDVENELVRHRDIISDFFRTAAERSRDGMVITFEESTLGITLDALVDLTRRFYTTLAHMFSSVYIPDDPQPDERWYAMIEGELFFLVSFAPCYPETSPRYTHGDQRTYFLLQPASTFERNVKFIDRQRAGIHRAFAAVGKPYDARLANLENDMFKAVMPIDSPGHHIPWWEPEGSTAQEQQDRHLHTGL